METPNVYELPIHTLSRTPYVSYMYNAEQALEFDNTFTRHITIHLYQNRNGEKRKRSPLSHDPRHKAL